MLFMEKVLHKWEQYKCQMEMVVAILTDGDFPAARGC